MKTLTTDLKCHHHNGCNCILQSENNFKLYNGYEEFGAEYGCLLKVGRARELTGEMGTLARAYGRDGGSKLH